MTSTESTLVNTSPFGADQGLGTIPDPTQPITGGSMLLSSLTTNQGAASDPFNTALLPIESTTLNLNGGVFGAGAEMGTASTIANPANFTALSLTGSNAGDTIVGDPSSLSTSQNVISPQTVSPQTTVQATTATPQVPGVFTVGQTGQVSVDFLFDSGAYQGEVAIFSLTGLEGLEPGSDAFIQEVARRALSGSNLGYIVISDSADGGRFSGELGEQNWGGGSHRGVQTFSLRAGDQVGFMLMPNGSVSSLLNGQTGDRPLFSMAIGSTPGHMADITGNGRAFGFEDINLSQGSDRDFNDIIFQVNGITGSAPNLSDVINPSRDWRGTSMGQTIIAHVQASLADEPPVTSPVTGPTNTLPNPPEGPAPEYPTDPVTGAQYAPGELLVYFTLDITESDIQSFVQIYGASGAELLQPASTQEGAIYLLRFGATIDLQAVNEALRQNSKVDFVEFNYVSLAQSDPRFSELWGLNNVGQTGGTLDADIDALEAWGLQTGSSSVVVAVVDTGVDYFHEDLRDNIWVNSGEIFGNSIDDDDNGLVDDVIGYDFVDYDNNPMDEEYHGTHIAGTIGAVGNNNIGITGVSPEVSIMPVRVLDPWGGGFNVDLMRAIDYAVTMGADIINLSFGGSAPSRLVYNAIRRANDAGVLVVAAAGNYGSNNDFFPIYPADYALPNVISVAATDDNDRLASFSNYGPFSVDLAAPGVDILSTIPGDGYYPLSGTSTAAPHVAGAAALLLAEDPSLTPTDLRNILTYTSDFIPALWGATISGGRLNVNNALQSLTPPLPTIGLNATLTNDLSITDPNNPTRLGTYADDYLLTGIQPGQQVRITMNGQFDTYIQLVNAATGLVIATNDDGGSSLSSDLVFTIQPGVAYLIRATSFEVNATGNYTLSTSLLEDITVGFPLQRTLNTSDLENLDRPGTYRDDYRLVGAEAGRELQINLAGNFDTYLQLVNASTGEVVAENDDGGGGFADRLTFTPSAGVNYLVRATGFAPGEIGTYTLEVEETIVPGQTVQRNLSSTDPTNPTRQNRFHDDYRLVGITAGQRLQINLDSGRFDAYLQLVNADTGAVITTDDDSGAGQNSQLTFTAASGVNYLIRATSYAPQAIGNYTLRVEEALETIGLNQPLNRSLSTTDPENVSRLGSYRDDYRLTGVQAGQQVQINLTGVFDPYLQVVNAATGEVVAFNDDGGSALNARLNFTPVAGVDYLVRATSFAPGAIGNYTLEVEETIAAGQTRQRTLSNTDPDNPTRAGRFHDDYRLTGVAAGQQLQVNLNSSSFDTYLQLVNANTGEVINFDDDGGPSLNSQLTFTAAAGTDYILRATSFSGNATGNYNLTVANATSPNRAVQGVLEATDGNNPTRSGRFADDFQLTGIWPGQEVRLTLNASFDPYLQLINADTGAVIAFNDDSTTSLASDLVFTVESGINYLARVTSFAEGATGTYTLNAFPAPLAIAPGQTQNQVLNNEDVNNPRRSGSFSEDFHLVGYTPGQQLVVTLTGGFDTFLQIINAATGEVIIADDDSAPGLNSQLVLATNPAIDYLVRVTSYAPNEKGNYSLSIA